MRGRAVVSAVFRLVAAWAALAFVAGWYGPSIVLAAAPGIQITVEQLLPGTIATLSSGAGGEPDRLTIALQAIRPIVIAGDYTITPFVKMQESFDAGHDLVPAIILWSVLLAWPYRRIGEALRAAFWGTFASSVLVIWIVAIHVAGLFEIRLQQVAEHLGQSRDVPFYLTHMLFFESGGQWLAGLVCAIVIARLACRGQVASATGIGATGSSHHGRVLPY